MAIKKILSTFMATLLLLVMALGAQAVAAGTVTKKDEVRAAKAQVRVPLNLAILVQDDLVPRVGNELEATRDFIRALPRGSRVMVGYIRSGSLQVRQPFTDDLEKASKALRIPVGSTAVSPFNPYVEVVEALRRFEAEGQNRNALLLISDGLDVSRGFDWSSSVNSIDLLRAIRHAKERNVAVYSFYAPSVGLTSRSRMAVSFGQSALNRLSDETGGRAFFQGTSFVTFAPYFEELGRTINRQYASVR